MSEQLQVVVGFGVSGLSAARHLIQQGKKVAVMDSRENPPNLLEFTHAYPDVPVTLGKFDADILSKASTIILSPGISKLEPAIVQAAEKGVTVIGDIELFARAAKAPVIAITGTNAKSTVTTLVGEMAKNAGLNVQVGGNLGVPALELLVTPQPDLFVVELSSFQLETTYSLKPKVATVLNVTPDHMDRYATLQDYVQVKQHVYSGCEVAVCNRDDESTFCHDQSVQRTIYFTLSQPSKNEFGLLTVNNQVYLAFEDRALMPVKDLPIMGRHYQANALAALALGYGYGLPMDAMLKTLAEFKGLKHRCEFVREYDGVRWYNDSKGTNVGATLAAIEGLGAVIKGQLILIAGGLGKNADFSPLVPAIEKYVKSVVLIGEAAPILADVIGDRVELIFAKTMNDAIEKAKCAASPNDSVLLSPACASYDMFKNFEHRGNVFVDLVQSIK